MFNGMDKIHDDNLGGVSGRRGSQESLENSRLNNVDAVQEKWTKPKTHTIELNQEKLDRITVGGGKDSELLRRQIELFDLIINGGHAVQIDLSTRENEDGKDQFHMIGVVDSNGDFASVPIFAFVNVYDGVKYKEDSSGKIRGIVIETGRENNVIYPDSSQERLDFMFKTIKFGVKTLPKDCKINVVRQTEDFSYNPTRVSNWPRMEKVAV